MPGVPRSITDDQFATEVLEADCPVVVDFWAAWCPPCRAMDPILADLATERPDIRFIKLDVDANQRTVVDHAVLSMPTLLVFRHGKEVLRLVGARPKRRLAQELGQVLGAATPATTATTATPATPATPTTGMTPATAAITPA